MQSSYCYKKKLRFKNFSKFPIGVETTLDSFISLARFKFKKTSFLWLKFTSRINSKKWPKYITRVICGLSIFFLFIEINNAIMSEFGIVFTKNVVKYFHQK